MAWSGKLGICLKKGWLSQPLVPGYVLPAKRSNYIFFMLQIQTGYDIYSLFFFVSFLWFVLLLALFVCVLVWDGLFICFYLSGLILLNFFLYSISFSKQKQGLLCWTFQNFDDAFSSLCYFKNWKH